MSAAAARDEYTALRRALAWPAPFRPRTAAVMVAKRRCMIAELEEQLEAAAREIVHESFDRAIADYAAARSPSARAATLQEIRRLVALIDRDAMRCS